MIVDVTRGAFFVLIALSMAVLPPTQRAGATRELPYETGWPSATGDEQSGDGRLSSTHLLSDVPWTLMINGWGPAERDRSNGDVAAGDGHALAIDGTTYAKGLGVHAASEIRYALNGSCSAFTAVVGVDDEVGSAGSVAFQVWTDGVKRFDSGPMTGVSPARRVSVDVTAAAELALIVTSAANDINSDHADWADAAVSCDQDLSAFSKGPNRVESIFPGDDIQARVSAAPPGTTFVLKSGMYRMQSVVPRSGDTFTGEPGTVLSGARLLTTVARSGSYWIAADQTQEGLYQGLDVCRPVAPRCDHPEDLFIDDVALQHVGSLPEVGPGKWYFDYRVNQIYFWDDPTGKRVETSVTPKAFGGPATGVAIRNLVIEKYANPTQEATVDLGTGWIIEDSVVRWNHFGGISTGPGSIARRNRVHHNGALGFQGSGADIVVANNEIAYNGVAGYNPYWCAGGSKWVWTARLVVRENFSHHNWGPGLWTDINNIYTLYENNTVEDNERGGIFHEISYDATIRQNTVRRNGTGRNFPYWTTGAGIEIVSSRNVEVYGNTVEDNWQGITGLNDHRGVGIDGPYVLTNLNVHHNTIRSRVTDEGGGRTGVVDTEGIDAFLPGANNRFHENTYSLGTKRFHFTWMGKDLDETEWRRFQQDMSDVSAMRHVATETD
jgi:parallel beta-helix repeat protein